jgi:hypothetical protein
MQQRAQAARANVQRELAEAEKRASEAKGHFENTRRLARNGELEATRKEAELTRTLAQAARAAATSAAKEGQVPMFGDQANVNLTRQAAERAEGFARAAEELVLVVESRQKMADVLTDFFKKIHPEIVKVFEQAKAIQEKAPVALEPVGGLDAREKTKLVQAITLLRRATREGYRLLGFARAFQRAAFAPKDDKGLDHLIELRAKKAFEEVERELAKSVETPADLENLTLREAGVADLEQPFEEAKQALARMRADGSKFLAVAAITMPPERRTLTTEKIVPRFIDQMKKGQAQLKAIVDLIADLQKARAGQQAGKEDEDQGN